MLYRTVKWNCTRNLFFCFLILSYPKILQATEYPPNCLLIDKEDEQRTRTATILAGATLVTLVGGVAYAAFGNSSHHHHHSSYSYNNSSDNCGCSSEYNSSWSHNYSSAFSHHHHHSNSYSFNGNDEVKWDGGVGPGHRNVNDDPIAGGEIRECSYCGSRAAAKNRASKTGLQIEGTFTTHPIPTLSGQGSITPFVQLPDGTTDTLETIALTRNGCLSFSYGPYTQKGTYAFGVHSTHGTNIPSQAKIGTLEIKLNGSRVQCGEFSPHSRQLIEYTTP